MRVAIALVALASSACTLPAGTYTTARALPAGKVQHAGIVEVAPYFDKRRGNSTEEERLANTYLPVQPGYGIRVGVASRVEFGAKLLAGSLDAGLKLQLVDSKHFAMALAPRVQSAGVVYLLPPYAAEVPLLLTAEAGRWSVTPRVGATYAGGHPDFPDFTAAFALVGFCTTLRVSRSVSFALDGYWLNGINRPIDVPGGGLAILLQNL